MIETGCQLYVIYNFIINLVFSQHLCFLSVHIDLCLINFNPFKPNTLFVGHRQTVHIQIRHCKNVASDQGLHCMLTEFSIKN